MIPDEFWEEVFTNLGFERTIVLGRTAFKIPIYEAIYMSQIMGASKKDLFEDDWRRRAGCIFIPIDHEKFLQFPESSPSVYLSDITLNEHSLNRHINPMLSPSLSLLKEEYPRFFKNKEKKFVILPWGMTEEKVKQKQITELIDEIKEEKLEPTDFVFFISPFNDRDPEYIGEHILEYLVSSYLRREGFIVDKFSEALKGENNRKFPDLFAIKIPSIQNKLIEQGIIENGAYLCELEMQNRWKSNMKIKEETVIAIEVESSKKARGSGASGGKGQLESSLESGYYNEGIVFAPFIDDIESDVKSYKIGFGTVGNDGKISLKRYPINRGVEENVKEINKQVERIIKLTLLKNLSLKNVLDLLPNIRSFYDLHFEVDKLEIEKIIESIKH